MNKTPSTSKLQGAEKKKVRWCTNEKKRRKKRVSPLKDLNMTTRTTKCDCNNPVFLFFCWFVMRNRSKEDKKNEYREKEDVK